MHHSPSWTTKNLDEDIFDGWHVRTAKAIQRLGLKDCQIECWLPEKTYQNEWQIERENITYRVFPSRAINYGREISYLMINALKSKTKQLILIHLHGIFNYTTYLISALFADLPIIAQHHGECPPLNLLQRRPLLYSILSLLELEQFVFTKPIHNIDYFFCLTKIAQQSLNYLGIKNKSEIQGIGIDFNIFKPNEKTIARKALNLPIDCKILLYIGKLDQYKGSDKLIKAYQILKAKYNLILVIVGANESDKFYQPAVQSGAIIFPRQSHNVLVKFYQASDVFVMPGSKQYNLWGGIGINTIESLACNTPVITGTLSHFPESINKIGMLASKPYEIINAVEYMLNNYNKFNDCRDIARKHYDWSLIANNTFNIYEKLCRKYYNIKLEKTNA